MTTRHGLLTCQLASKINGMLAKGEMDNKLTLFYDPHKGNTRLPPPACTVHIYPYVEGV
jgi:hypothetical protein